MRSSSSPATTSTRWTTSRSSPSTAASGPTRPSPSAGRPKPPPRSAAAVSRGWWAGGPRVYGYRFDGYWQDVGTIQSYWEANMALLEDRPELDLYDREWLIHTRSEERAPAKVGATAQVHRSLVSHG